MNLLLEEMRKRDNHSSLHGKMEFAPEVSREKQLCGCWPLGVIYTSVSTTRGQRIFKVITVYFYM